MIKQHKKQLILTSIVTLIPMVMGLLLWKQLPDLLPSHWDINGNVDNWSSKAFTVFGMPVFLLALQWFAVFASSSDPKYTNYHPKLLAVVLWICPLISLICSGLSYTTALGFPLQIERIVPVLLGLMFVILGNLMPKSRQTYTMGIRLPWTLASEENWNKTHRLAGKIWVAGGIVSIALAFLNCLWLFLAVLVLMAAIPTLYSYLHYRHHEKNN